MDPGPYGCLGAGPGPDDRRQARAPDWPGLLPAPRRRRLRLLGPRVRHDGPEHGIPVVGVIGNNGIWALEHHPMKFLYGYSVAAELRPETRYDQVTEALGCHAELVSDPDKLVPALERAFPVRQAGARQRPHRPRGRLPAQVQPGLGRRALGPAQAMFCRCRQRHQPARGADREERLGRGADDQFAPGLEHRGDRSRPADEPSPRAGPAGRRRVR